MLPRKATKGTTLALALLARLLAAAGAAPSAAPAPAFVGSAAQPIMRAHGPLSRREHLPRPRQHHQAMMGLSNGARGTAGGQQMASPTAERHGKAPFPATHETPHTHTTTHGQQGGSVSRLNSLPPLLPVALALCAALPAGEEDKRVLYTAIYATGHSLIAVPFLFFWDVNAEQKKKTALLAAPVLCAWIALLGGWFR